jgi:hypothetical protein
LVSSIPSDFTRANFLPESIKKRLLLFVKILTDIPDEGLDELDEAIERIREFYTEEVALPAPRINTPKIVGTIKHTFVRPDFPLSDED